MFIDQMPTKRVDLPNGQWVDVQYLSKGYKDEERSVMASLSSFFKPKSDEQDRQFDSSGQEQQEKIFKKLREIENKRVVAGIKAWSVDRPITLDNVKLLKEETFDIILAAIDQFNSLTKEEEKN